MSEPSESELCEWAAGFLEPKPTEPYQPRYEQWLFAPGQFKGETAIVPCLNFATDLNAVALVERKIAEMGLQEAYGRELSKTANTFGKYEANGWVGEDLFKLATAPAIVRLRAAYRVCNESGVRK